MKPALALPGSLEVTEIEIIDEVLTITAVSTQIAPRCPVLATLYICSKNQEGNKHARTISPPVW